MDKNLSDNSIVPLYPKSLCDKVIDEFKLPHIYQRNQSNIIFLICFHSILENGARTIFKVGRNFSVFFPYFKSYYGFSFSDHDYSEMGCEMAKRNLQYFGRDLSDNFYCAEVTQLTAHQFGIFDILFYYRLIENFEMSQTILSSIGILVVKNYTIFYDYL